MRPDELLSWPAGAASLELRLAGTAAEVRAAQHLRYSVFADELGARLDGDGRAGLDCDRFDAYCEHLIVRAPASNRVVGTYRILSPEGRRRAGGWYCASEFDVGRLEAVADDTVEIGRACVDPAYRSGHTIALLWTGLLRYIIQRRCQYVIGCASLGTADGGHIAASICRRMLQEHLAVPQWRVVPRRAFVLEGWREIADAPLPPLLKGYLRLGARVCGEPAWDPNFNTADLLMMLSLAEMNPRYVERLLRTA